MKCHWLSFDTNSPGAESHPNSNFELYQKKGECLNDCSSSDHITLSEQHFSLHKLNTGQSSLCQGMKDVQNNLTDLLTALFKKFLMTASFRGRTRKDKKRCCVYCAAVFHASFFVVK